MRGYQLFDRRYVEIEREQREWFVVFRAQHGVTGETVNICTPSERLLGSPERLRRFVGLCHTLQDVENASRAGFAYIAPTTTDNRCYLTCAAAEDTLAEALTEGRKFGLRQTVSVMMRTLRICRAFATSGYVGIDLLPHNIGIQTAGVVQVVGLFNNDAALDIAHPYAAPELRHGASPNAQSDVYAVGAMGLNMLLGNAQFSALLHHRNLQASDFDLATLIPNFPIALERVINQLIAVDAHTRPPSAALALEELKHAVRAANEAYHLASFAEDSGQFDVHELTPRFSPVNDAEDIAVPSPVELEIRSAEAVERIMPSPSDHQIDRPRTRRRSRKVRSRHRHGSRRHQPMSSRQKTIVFVFGLSAMLIACVPLAMVYTEARARSHAVTTLKSVEAARVAALSVDAGRVAEREFGLADKQLDLAERAIDDRHFEQAAELAMSARKHYRAARQLALEVVSVKHQVETNALYDSVNDTGFFSPRDLAGLKQAKAKADGFHAGRNFEQAIASYEGLAGQLTKMQRQIEATTLLEDVRALREMAVALGMETIQRRIYASVTTLHDHGERALQLGELDDAVHQLSDVQKLLTNYLLDKVSIDTTPELFESAAELPRLLQATRVIRTLVRHTGAAGLAQYQGAEQLMGQASVDWLLARPDAARQKFTKAQTEFDEAAMAWATQRIRDKVLRAENKLSGAPQDISDDPQVVGARQASIRAQALLERKNYAAATRHFRQALSVYRALLSQPVG